MSRVIIAGSRNLPKDHPPIYYVADAYFKSGFKASEIVSGGCRGVDLAGEQFAQERQIPIKRFDPDWDKYGKSAGPIRNREMGNYGDALIAIWFNESKGTADMIRFAHQRAIPVYVYKL